jgi:uncharacterized protein YbgA (DUF1722 family)
MFSAEQYQKLKPFVNSIPQWQVFSDLVDFYIERQHKIMEQTNNVAELHKAQGALATLRQFQNLKDVVNGCN